VSINERLSKLEHAAGADRCEACGLDLHGWPAEIVFGKISFDLNTEPTPRPQPTPCQRCGRIPAWFTFKIGEKPITFDGDKEISTAGNPARKICENRN
jgi:hypothetical protein